MKRKEEKMPYLKQAIHPLTIVESTYGPRKAVVVKEFSFAKSFEKQRPKQFNEFVNYRRKNPDVRVVLFENTDRISRNLQGFVTVEVTIED